MPLSLFNMYDIAIIVILCIFIFQGYSKGLIPSFKSFGFFFAIGLGIIFNEYIANMLYPLITLSFIPISIQSLLIQYLAFITFIVIAIVFTCLWNIMMNIIGFASKVTLLSLSNKLAGAAFGLIKGIIIIFVLRYLFVDVLEVIPAEVLQSITFFQYLSF